MTIRQAYCYTRFSVAFCCYILSSSLSFFFFLFFFFFQAEDGIRLFHVTGVQTCALPICPYGAYLADGSEYTGAYDLPIASLLAFHRPRLELLLEEQPDWIAFETFPNPREVEAIARLLDEIGRALCRESVGVGGERRALER